MILGRITAVVAVAVVGGLRQVLAQADGGLSTNCTTYTGQTCMNYVNYKVLGPTATLDMPELSNLSASLGRVDPVCVDNYFRYMCSLYIPKCEPQAGGQDILTMGCASTCQQVLTTCKTTLTLIGQSALLPDCSQPSPITHTTLQDDNHCNFIPAQVEGYNPGIQLESIPPEFVLDACPDPFVRDPKAKQGTTDSINPVYCRFGCCIPCPAQNMFYPEGWAERGFLAADIVRMIAAVLSFAIVVSYLVLPDKRHYPSILILNLTAAIALFSISSFFSLAGPKRQQCADAINPSTQDNNHSCGAQGALLVFSCFSMITWSAALILNLHLHIVWNSNFFSHRYAILNVVCWGIPTVFMAVTLGLHQVRFEFANTCLVAIESIFNLFFYPIVAIICPAFLMHMITFTYIAKAMVHLDKKGKSTGLTRKHIVAAVKVQWRALLLAVIALSIVLFYWIFYYTQMSRLSKLPDNSPLINAWLECMLSTDGNQNACVPVVSPSLPPFGLMITTEVVASSIGIWVFLVFGKQSLWREWGNWIYDMRVRLTPNQRERNSQHFYAL